MKPVFGHWLTRSSLAFLLLTAGASAGGVARADVCNSPFLKYLDRPERIMYVWSIDADQKDNDLMAVVDVDEQSKTYGKILRTIDLGSKGNEPHHFGFTDDRRRIFGATLFTSKLYVYDVATDPKTPKQLNVIEF
jgi:methanethiol oxidase